MHRQLDVAVFQTKETSSLALITVTVGNATVLASKDAPHVKLRATPLSVMLILSVSPSTGVPVRLVVKEVIGAFCAVICTTSYRSVLMAGVPVAGAYTSTRFVIRLLVKVCVSVVPTTVPLGAVAEHSAVAFDRSPHAMAWVAPSATECPAIVIDELARSVLATVAQVATPAALRLRGNWLVQVVPA